MSENNSNSEITSKIRAAIKAKLTELGAYVDEELPDYIMVMIANKKTKQQMTDDLNLFLGKNSTLFTEWLQNVLDRLQSISRSSSSNVVQAVSQTVAANASAKEVKAASKSSSNSKEKPRKASPERKKKPRSPSPETPPPRHRRDSREEKPSSSKHRRKNEPKRGKYSSSDRSDSSDSEEERRKKRVEKKDLPRVGKDVRKDEVKSPALEIKKNDLAKKKDRVENHGRAVEMATAAKNQPKAMDEDVLVVRAEVEEGDEMADLVVLPKEKQLSVSAPSTTIPRTDHPHRTVTLVETKPTQAPAQAQAPSATSVTVRKPIEAPSPDANTWGRRHVGTVRPMKRRTPSPTEGPSRKRRSTIGQVIHHPEHSNDDDLHEEYDPLRPQLGLSSATAVASTVHVTERKYTVPREMQPKPSIFLRALNEANRSVKIGQRRGNEERTRSSRNVEDSVRPTTSRGLFNRISREDSKEGKQEAMDAANGADESRPITRRIQLRKPIERSEIQEIPQPIQAPNDDADVIVIESGPSTMGDDEKKEPNTRFVVTMSGLDKKYERVVIKEDEAKVAKMQEKDYYDEDTLIVDVDEAEMMEEAMMIYSATGKTAAMISQGPTPGKQIVNPIKISLDDDDDDEEVTIRPSDVIIASLTPSGSNDSVAGSPRVVEDVPLAGMGRLSSTSLDTMGGKSMERCRYWPNCHLGDGCHYQHPTTPCKNFPQCRFGDKCLYIHPPCKFDAYCKNPRCPYAHSQTSAPPGPASYGMKPRMPAMASQAASAFIPCKFGGRCTNVTCPYRHPQAPCMYGPTCTKSNCAYSHRPNAAPQFVQRPVVSQRPAAPKADVAKFRWVATPASADQVSNDGTRLAKKEITNGGE